jgi:AraC-like DNA-binding protein
VPVGPEGRVVISSISGGASACTAKNRPGVKYVAAGAEVYRLGGKTYSVSAGQFLLVPPGAEGEAAYGRSGDGKAVGLCLYFPETWEGTSALDRPMLFPAACSVLGRTVEEINRRLHRPNPARVEMARKLLELSAANIEPLIEETVQLLDGLDTVRPATRYELLRRLNVARSFLHSVTDRPVELAELSQVAGTSRFHLLRNFRRCFGAPPAAYHRQVRLELARAEIEARRIGCGEAAHRFGFADSSSFSHAYRRAFGHPPTRPIAA